MKAEEMRIMHDIIKRMSEQKMTREELASMLHVERTTIDKQFTKLNGELTLATAYRYAEALQCAIVLLSDEELETLKSSELIKNQNEKLNQVISDLMRERESMQRQADNYSSSLERLKRQNDDFQRILEEKNEIIRRLLDKYVFT